MSLNQRIANLERAVHKLEQLINTPRKQDETGVSPQDASSKEGDTAERKPPPVPQIEPSPRDTNNAKQAWYKTIEGWKTALEVIGIPFAIGYAIVTYMQWQDLRRNFEFDQRAWVGFTGIDKPSDVAVGDFKVRITTENRGKTPAIHSTIKIGIAEPYCARILPSDPFQLMKSMPETVQTSLLPNHPLTSGTVKVSISPDNLRDLKDKTECRLLVFASVDYCDVFGSAHFRHFCGYWNPNGTPKEFDICESYNDGDEDYPNKKPPKCPTVPNGDIVTVTTK